MPGVHAPAERPRYVFIASTAYSGSTLLATLLSAHPEIASVGGASSTRRARDIEEFACSCLKPMLECSFWLDVRDRMHAASFADFDLADFRLSFDTSGPLGRVTDGSLRFGRAEALRDRALTLIPSRRRWLDDLGRRHAAFAKAVLGASGAGVFVETSKERMRTRRLALLGDYLDLRVIHLVRDVRGVTNSALGRGRYDGDAVQVAHSWNHTNAAIMRALRELPTDRTLVVRYEDLCRAPDTTLGRIHALCGVPPIAWSPGSRPRQHLTGNKVRLGDLKEIRLDERWRTGLSSRQQHDAVAAGGSVQRTFYPQTGPVGP